jgi:hypothetical protein
MNLSTYITSKFINEKLTGLSSVLIKFKEILAIFTILFAMIVFSLKIEKINDIEFEIANDIYKNVVQMIHKSDRNDVFIGMYITCVLKTVNKNQENKSSIKVFKNSLREELIKKQVFYMLDSIAYITKEDSTYIIKNKDYPFLDISKYIE